MNRRIPPDELPWFKRSRTEVTPSGQLLYSCPIGLAHMGAQFTSLLWMFPYIARTWSVYQPRILVISVMAPILSIMSDLAGVTIDHFDAGDAPVTFPTMVDIVPHYDLILACYGISMYNDPDMSELLDRNRCMLVQWSPTLPDIYLSSRDENEFRIIYSGFCAKGSWEASKFVQADLHMFYNL